MSEWSSKLEMWRDRREKIVRLYKDGLSPNKIARIYNVSGTWIRKVLEKEGAI